MSASIEAGDLRNCPSCGSRNKASFKYCVRCSVAMDAPAAARPVRAAAARPTYAAPAGGSRRLLLAAGAIALIAAGLAIRTVVRATQEASVISGEVRADGAGAVLPPPAISGWTPGAGLPAAPDAPPAPSSSAAPSWSSESFPVATTNPYDVPGDPNASMVGIAPRAPRARAAMLQKRVFTDNDLLATRGGH